MKAKESFSAGTWHGKRVLKAKMGGLLGEPSVKLLPKMLAGIF